MRILPSTSAVQYSGTGPPSVRGDGPQVVEAEQVVGVVVREQHGVDDADALAEQLQAQLGRRVDEQIALRRADEDGAAIAVVARVGRAADGAVAADHGHADRGAGAEESEGTRLGHHALNRASGSGVPTVGTAPKTVILANRRPYRTTVREVRERPQRSSGAAVFRGEWCPA